MAAPRGNKYWMMRSSHGRHPIFVSPQDLESACYEYFQWVDDNPLVEEKIFHANGKITRAKAKKLRPMTISGMCLFLDITEDTWKNYKCNQDFLGICTAVEKTIYNQKFAGATADLMNPSIIARELGLADKKDVELTDNTAIQAILESLPAEMRNQVAESVKEKLKKS